MGCDSQLYLELSHKHPNPTAALFKLNSNLPIYEFIQTLELMDRFDVIDDTVQLMGLLWSQGQLLSISDNFTVFLEMDLMPVGHQQIEEQPQEEQLIPQLVTIGD